MGKKFGESNLGVQLNPLSWVESGSSGPDPSQPYFDPTTVITRSATDEIVSRYSDVCWDYRAHSMDGSTAQTLHFWRVSQVATLDTSPALSERIYEQHKALFWAFIDYGDTKSFGTLNSYNFTAQALCTAAYETGVDLFTLLTDVERIGEICEDMRVSDLAATSALVRTLWRHRKRLLGGDAQMQRDTLIEKIRAAQARLPETKQTPLIPSRVYCSILAGLLEGLDSIERNLDVLLNALRNCREATIDISEKLPQASRQEIATQRRKVLAQTKEEMSHLGWEAARGKTLISFIQGKIYTYQSHLMHALVAFTGMRVGEAKILPLNNVLETFKHRGQVHHLAKGYTYKLNGGEKKATEWITNDQGHRAIKLAIRIGEAVLSVHKTKPQKGQEALLFPSTSHPFRMMASAAFLAGQKYLIKTICPVITADDLSELNELELERGWDRDGIEIGKRWPLAMHQLRRSLSVYAHRSGMVSLPALKAQLQHITDEMRAYYADGWSRAVNLVFDKNHFSQEWNAAKIESTYFGMTGALKLAFDDGENLLGTGAQRMEQILLERSRHQTLALIKNGIIAYRETVLGGCISTEECKAMPLMPINFECVESNCVNLVVQSKRLDLVIRSQEGVVAQLERDEKGSVAQRLETEHLKRMLVGRDRLRDGASVKEAKA
jgi:integrase